MTTSPFTPLPSHDWEHNGVTTTFTWLGDVDITPDRVYAIPFTPDGRILLVSSPDRLPAGWLPGGGVEAGETPAEALARELLEEADAIMGPAARIGVQHYRDTIGRHGHQAFYWCRVTFDRERPPTTESLTPLLVAPTTFLDRLFYGRTDPKAPLLLHRALALQTTAAR